MMRNGRMTGDRVGRHQESVWDPLTDSIAQLLVACAASG